jgi:light-regulated signal transduction histidine kinase (bacteriophytochrome)
MLLETLQTELGEQQSEEVLQIISMATDKSTQLITMIERLLEFSKMCNIVPNMETLDLKTIVEETFEELVLLEPNRKITLVCDTLPPVFGDKVLIKMLVKNVVSNAVKFTRNREHATLTVSTETDTDYTAISFTDNGAGFDMAYADKLFKVFQRLHLASEFEGTGVGLALVDRIMKRHGGKVTAYGEVNHGAKITLYFQKLLEV